MSQEQEKAIKEISLAARMDERDLHEQVENTTNHYPFDVEWERLLGKVTAQAGLLRKRDHLHVTSKCLQLWCFQPKKKEDIEVEVREKEMGSVVPPLKRNEDLISDGPHITTPSTFAPEQGRKLHFLRFKSQFSLPASSHCLFQVFRTST